MNQILEMAQYNIWANNKFIKMTQSVSQDKLYQDLSGSFGSVFETILHLAAAEKIWVERLSGQANPFLANEFKGTFEELIAIWQQNSVKLMQLAQRIPAHCLVEKITYSNLKGDLFSREVYQVFAHVFNHGSYHRGQLLHMLKELKVSQIESTDLIRFYNEKNNV